jgi:signal transduction histidine kinase
MADNHSNQPSWMRGFLIFWRAILWISLAVSIFFAARDDPALLRSWRGPATLLAVAGFVLVYELYERGDSRRSGRWPLPYRLVLAYLVVQLALVLLLLHVSGGFVGALFALMAQVFAALPMRRWPVPTAAIVAVIAMPLGLADAWVAGDWGSVVGFALSMASWVAIAVFVGALFHERHQHERLIAELHQAKERLERYASQAEELAALQERARLAREMHDSLGHALVVVNVKLEAAQRLYAVDAPRGDAELEGTRALVRATMADLRRSLSNLRAEPPAQQSLPAALRQIADEARARSGLAIECAAPPELPPLAPAVAEALWRVAREALANVERHAGAASASLSLARADGQLVLRVADDGAGLAPGDLARPGHYGITGMRERVEALGGTLRVAAQPHGGTLVEAQVPIS